MTNINEIRITLDARAALELTDEVIADCGCETTDVSRFEDGMITITFSGVKASLCKLAAAIKAARILAAA